MVHRAQLDQVHSRLTSGSSALVFRGLLKSVVLSTSLCRPPNLAIILLQRPVNKSDLRTYECNQTSEVWRKLFLCIELKLSILAGSTQWDSTVCARSSGPATRRDFRFLLLGIGQLRLLFFCSSINSNSFTETLEALHRRRWINARTHVVASGCYITAWLWCCGFVLVHWARVAPEVLPRDFERYSRDQIPEQTLSEQSSP